MNQLHFFPSNRKSCVTHQGPVSWGNNVWNLFANYYGMTKESIVLEITWTVFNDQSSKIFQLYIVYIIV